MNAKDFTEEQILAHFKDSGQVICSVRLASSNDFVITLTSKDDYEVVKEDIIPDREMVLFTPGNK